MRSDLEDNIFLIVLALCMLGIGLTPLNVVPSQASTMGLKSSVFSLHAKSQPLSKVLEKI